MIYSQVNSNLNEMSSNREYLEKQEYYFQVDFKWTWIVYVHIFYKYFTRNVMSFNKTFV